VRPPAKDEQFGGDFWKFAFDKRGSPMIPTARQLRAIQRNRVLYPFAPTAPLGSWTLIAVTGSTACRAVRGL
jgi:hypothetical protein